MSTDRAGRGGHGVGIDAAVAGEAAHQRPAAARLGPEVALGGRVDAGHRGALAWRVAEHGDLVELGLDRQVDADAGQQGRRPYPGRRHHDPGVFRAVLGLDPGHPVPFAQQRLDRRVRPVAHPPLPGRGQQVPGDQRAVPVSAVRLPGHLGQVLGADPRRERGEAGGRHGFGPGATVPLHGHVGPQGVLLAGQHDAGEPGPADERRAAGQLGPGRRTSGRCARPARPRAGTCSASGSSPTTGCSSPTRPCPGPPPARHRRRGG